MGARRNENGLTEKWQLFADTFLADPKQNATAAYKAAYPNVSQRVAEASGARLLRRDEVAEYIAKAVKERAERTKINFDYVVERLAAYDELDPLDILDPNGNLLPLQMWPKIWRQAISGFEILEVKGRAGRASLLKKIKWPDKHKNLELIGKLSTVGAFRERVEVSGQINVTIAPDENDL